MGVDAEGVGSSIVCVRSSSGEDVRSYVVVGSPNFVSDRSV